MNKAFLSWEDVAGRIGELLRQGEYAPQAVLDAARDNAMLEHARVLAYMERDLADGVSEIVFEDSSIFRGGFQDVEKNVASRLADPAFLEDLCDRLEGLALAYKENPEVMRFNFYKPDLVAAQFRRLRQDAVPYAAREGFSWETGEKRPFLCAGGRNGAEAGKRHKTSWPRRRSHSPFTNDHGPKAGGEERAGTIRVFYSFPVYSTETGPGRRVMSRSA